MVEADFLPPLQLHHPALVDHQLDRPVTDGLESVPKLPKERRRQRNRDLRGGGMISRPGSMHAH
jgi:hypothetical protein